MTMRRFLLSLSVSMMVIFGMAFALPQADGQEPGPNYEHLKGAEHFIGKWAHVGTTADKQKLEVVRTFAWTLGKNYLTGETRIKVDGQPTLARHHMAGWNPVRELPKSWVFDSDGTFATGLWTEFGRNKLGKVTGIRTDKTKISATIRYTFEDEDTFIYRATNRLEGGVAKPDFEWKFKRIR